MEKNTFLDFINEKNTPLTKDEIEEILNEELIKNENEMDTELVSKCIELLGQINSGDVKPEQVKEPKTNNKKSKKVINIKRVLLVAAIIALLGALTLSTSANFFNFDIPKELAKFFKSYVSVDMSGDGTSTIEKSSYGTIEKEFETKGYTDLVLPAFLRESDVKVINTTFTENNLFSSCNIMFYCPHFQLDSYIIINSYYDEAFLDSKNIALPDSGKCIDVNNNLVYIFQQDDFCVITYNISSTEYVIHVNGSLDKAVEIAETIT